MAGIKELQNLLKNLDPRLAHDTFVFTSIDDETAELLTLDPLFTFREEEGLTAVLKKKDADAAGLEYQGSWRCITLMVQSDLEAVGLLARVTSALSEAGIPCNTVSAFHHDHLFVPERFAEKSVEILQALTK